MSKLNFTVNKEKCIKCNLCINDCITKIIQTDDEGYPQIPDETNCIGCQHCLAICPKGAISILGKDADNSFYSDNKPNPEQLEALIKTRRSCRNYKQENVSKETIEKLKNILNWVPTGVNFKDLHFAIVENMNTMNEIRDSLYKKLKFILKFIPIKGHFSAYKQAIFEGEDIVFRNAPHMIVVSANKNAPCKDIDPIIALSYFELYAQSLGLGTLWCGIAYKTLPLSKNVMKRFDIPKTHKLSYVMLFGYPNVNYQRSVQPESYNIKSL